MIDTIYIEEAVLDHARSREILSRYPKAEHIVVARYAEIFNSHTQNFRLQKTNPALILAEKNNQRVLSTPEQYETGGGANYYFSHMLNCLYDCRYCFLQGMYRSANYLLFVNYEDFITDIKCLAEKHQGDQQPPWFFSGYDCDSLALEPVTGFAEFFLSEMSQLEHAVLELRTKSTQIRSLLRHQLLENVVVAFSLSPQAVASAIEQGAPPVAKRLRAMVKLQRAGWRIGVRFDPVIWHAGWQQSYQELLEIVFTELDPHTIDSVTLGGFRLPKGYFKTMRKLHPEHWLFNAGLDEDRSMVSYTRQIEAEMFADIEQCAMRYIDHSRIFSYPSHEPLHSSKPPKDIANK